MASLHTAAMASEEESQTECHWARESCVGQPPFHADKLGLHAPEKANSEIMRPLWELGHE